MPINHQCSVVGRAGGNTDSEQQPTTVFVPKSPDVTLRHEHASFPAPKLVE